MTTATTTARPVNPLVVERADPWILKSGDTYFFTGSFPAFDRIVLRGADTLAGLSDAPEVTIWTRPSEGEMGGNIWAPELHQIADKWYFYFTAGHADKPFRIRMYAIEGVGADPRTAVWSEPRRIEGGWDEFALDATVFEHRGDLFYVWAQRPVQEPGLPDGVVINSDMYIARMSDPFTLATEPTLLTRPTLAWENVGYRVNEGAAVLKRNDKIFITFSASATDYNYAMGLLTADQDADLLDPTSWHKTPEPVLVSSDLTRSYGPGHNSFTTDEQGNDVLVYHARSYRDIIGNPLFDPNRHGRIQPFFFDEAGNPAFGLPVGDGQVPVQVVGETGKILAVSEDSIVSAPVGGNVVGEAWQEPVPVPELTVTELASATRTQVGTTATLFRVITQDGAVLRLAPVVSPGHEVDFDLARFPALGGTINLQ